MIIFSSIYWQEAPVTEAIIVLCIVLLDAHISEISEEKQNLTQQKDWSLPLDPPIWNNVPDSLYYHSLC